MQRRGERAPRGREALKRVGDPSGGNRSGDSRWVPDPSVPVMDVGEKPKARSPSICAPTRFYDSFWNAVFQAVSGCLITLALALLPWLGGFCRDDGNDRSFFTANLLMWNIMLLV